MLAADTPDGTGGSKHRAGGTGDPGRLTRRRFGAVAVVGVALLAGCTGSTDGGDDATPSPSPTPTPTATATPGPDPDAQSNIEAASESFFEVSGNFRRGLENLDQSLEYVDFNTEHIYGWLERAAGQIEAAEASATPGQLEQIDALWALYDWFYPLVDAMAAYDAGLEAMSRAETYWSNGRYEEAIVEYERAWAAFDEGRGFIDDADVAYEAIDLSPFGMSAEGELALDREAGNRLATAIDGMGYAAQFQVDYLAGIQHFLVAGPALDAGDYDVAHDQFQLAEGRFSEAHITARDGEAAAPDWLLERFLLHTCSTEALVEASQHYVDAAVAGRNGDMEGSAAAEARAEAAIDNMC